MTLTESIPHFAAAPSKERYTSDEQSVLPLYRTKTHLRSNHLSTAAWAVATCSVFLVSWTCTGGGYKCSIALCALLTIHCYSLTLLNPWKFCKEVGASLRLNVVHLLREEKRSAALIVVYWVAKVVLVIWLPTGEQSNGSPNSLIFFTILFVTLYIVPTLLPVLFCPCALLWRTWKHTSQGLRFRCLNGPFPARHVREASAVVWRWRRSIAVIFCLLLLTYLCDADLTSILRYLGNGKPCWPLLIPKHLRKNLPHPFQHAWFARWSELFAGYRPGPFTRAVVLLGRELGEVCRLLPVLIGTYIFAQLTAPRKFQHIKIALFASIAGVVLGGVTSGSFKILIHRYRPNAYGNPYFWTGPATTVVNHLKFSKLDLSFPAGHTTVTSAVATCLYQMVMCYTGAPSLPKWLRILLAVCVYVYPFVVLVSRVSDCYHWTSDAVFGVSPVLALSEPL